jgi:hypothetical protein
MTRSLSITPGWFGRDPLSIWQRGSTRQCFLALAGLTAVLLVIQGFVLFPLAKTDPQLAGLPDDVSLQETFWVLRAFTIALAPLILSIRVVAVTMLLHGVLALWGDRLRWSSVFDGVLRAEGIFLLESACSTAVLLWHAPASLQAAEEVPFRAGLDLVWQPANAGLATLLAAANVFVVLWALQIRTVLGQTSNMGSTSRHGVALLFGVLLVLVRSIALNL